MIHFLMALIATISFAATNSFFSLSAKDIDGAQVDFKTLQGQVVLVVNTASQCGYTDQYESLQTLYAKYKGQGLTVLGFPSNDFGGQEPGSNQEIKKFCQLNFKVDFPLFEKGPVKGAQKQPVYQFLTSSGADQSEVKWNFEKFLIGRDGKVKARFPSKIEPLSSEITTAIEKELRGSKAPRS